MEKNQVLLGTLAFFLGFLAINFNTTLAIVYICMIVGYYLFTDDNNQMKYGLFKSESSNRWVESLFYGAIGYAVFIVITGFAIKQFFGDTNTLQAITNWTMAAVLENSKIIQFMSIGILVPILESISLGAGVFILMNYSKLNPNNIKYWVIPTVFFGAVAVFYHLQAKGIRNTESLAITAIFFALQTILVLFRKQWADAVMMHILNNSYSIMKS